MLASVDADVGTDIFDAAGITLTTSAGGQYDELQSSGDITITATNSTALIFDLLDAGATSASSIGLTASA